ncbi:unnamed protein product [Thlaspi arvense]|uniref:DUF3444 domain-containing protein n=1 Tax=Thlaspi arvense TaxID=13288 RepID=A0AAU9ST64_THLAR|nr:unnamed protein product [Thlaspi arvense]
MPDKYAFLLSMPYCLSPFPAKVSAADDCGTLEAEVVFLPSAHLFLCLMMDINSNELLRRKAVSETLMKGTCSDVATTFSSAPAVNVHSPGLSFAVCVGEKRKRNASNDIRDAESGEELVQPKISESAGLKFNDFEKLREDVNFAVGQTWAVYDDKVDGMPRLYARIRKVSAPSFEFRITYLEPDPDDEREIQWFEQDLPVSAGQFRLGKNHNTKDRSIFSHVVHCNEGNNTGHLTVTPRKGETWALFKNWDIKWSTKITLTQAFEQAAELKLHVGRLKASPYPQNFIKWEDKGMPVGCGTFFVAKTCSTITPDNVSHQIVPKTSMDGDEYTILPKIGEVWVIYRSWAPHFDVDELERDELDFDIVEVLDDALKYKVLALERALFPNEEKSKIFRAAKSRPSECCVEDGSGVIFTIPKWKILRFSHQVPASRVTKEIDGEVNVLFEVDSSAIPCSTAYRLSPFPSKVYAADDAAEP